MSRHETPLEDRWVDSPLKDSPLSDEETQAWSGVHGWIGRHEFAYAGEAPRRAPLVLRVAAAAAMLLFLAAFAIFNFARLGSRAPVVPASTPSVAVSPSAVATASPVPSPTVAPSPRAVTPGPANPPPAGSWSALPPMSQPRSGFTATVIRGGKVLIVGGVADTTVSGSATSNVQIFDPSTRTYANAASLSIGRTGHTATALPDGRVVVVGGYTQLGNASLASVEIYDPVTDSWKTAAPLQHGRAGHAAVLMGGGKVMVVGGAAYAPVGISPHGSAAATLPPEIYDPATDTWTTAAMPRFDRPVHPTATLLRSGRVLVVGGQYMWNSPDEATERSEVYNPVSNTWYDVAIDPRFVARQDHTATLLDDGMVLVAGGSFDLQPIGTAALYDPASNSWLELPNLAAARCGQAAQLLNSGRVLLVGSGCWNHETASAEEYDPTSHRFYAVASLPRPRGLAVAVSPDENVVVLGGTENEVATASAVLFTAS